MPALLTALDRALYQAGIDPWVLASHLLGVVSGIVIGYLACWLRHR